MGDSDDICDVPKQQMEHQPMNEHIEAPVVLGEPDTGNASIATTTIQHQNLEHDEESRLDYELQLLQSMRISFVSALHILEAARDELSHSIPNDIDELRRASERIRAALTTLREHIQ